MFIYRYCLIKVEHFYSLWADGTVLIHVFAVGVARLYLWLRHLTHWGRDEMPAILQATFSKTFSWMKMYEFRLRFHKFVPKVPNDNISALVQIMAWRRPGDKPLSEPMISFLTHICVTWPQCVNAIYSCIPGEDGSVESWRWQIDNCKCIICAFSMYCVYIVRDIWRPWRFINIFRQLSLGLY